MSKTIIVSNRLPLQISIKNEKINVATSVGGLATGLQSLHQKGESYWVGWNGLSEEDVPCEFKRKQVEKITSDRRCIPVALSREELKHFYEKFSNEAIWPLFHYFAEYANFDERSWEVYQSVNEKFAAKVLEIADSKDIIWVHDYQLMLVPLYLKESDPDLTVGFFLHIPFPSFEIFRLLPYREKILEGMLGADLVGFHTKNYKQYFLTTAGSLLECEIENETIKYNNRTSLTESFPMGIDYEKFETAAIAHKNQDKHQASSLQKELNQYKATHDNVKLILSVDRLDYTKGVADRIKAFDFFLDHYPRYRKKVSLLMLMVPSRTKVPQYKSLKKEIDRLVGYVNSKFGNIGWTPIWYFYRSMPFKNLIDLYTNCDIALITPLRDGMNLVAKEYIASRTDQKGVLILSEMAGAAEELAASLIINPNNYEEVAAALTRAIEMSEEEQIKRNKILQAKIKKSNVKNWSEEFIKKLSSTKKISAIHQPKIIDHPAFNSIFHHYSNAKLRILFLDYDGTLVGFKRDPQKVIPDKELKKIIRKLCKDPKNEVVIVSGRDKETLSKWWADIPIFIMAEHGLFLRTKDERWTAQADFNNDWIPQFKSLLEAFVRKVPKSFIEEKNNSLVWHYRASDHERSEKAVIELKAILSDVSNKYELTLLEGNKNIELLNKHINKGKAVRNFVAHKNEAFIMALGDDTTDEFMFQHLPASSVTIKVGTGETHALYRLADFKEVRLFLAQLTDGSEKHVPVLTERLL